MPCKSLIYASIPSNNSSVFFKFNKQLELQNDALVKKNELIALEQRKLVTTAFDFVEINDGEETGENFANSESGGFPSQKRKDYGFKKGGGTIIANYIQTPFNGLTVQGNFTKNQNGSLNVNKEDFSLKLSGLTFGLSLTDIKVMPPLIENNIFTIEITATLNVNIFFQSIGTVSSYPIAVEVIYDTNSGNYEIIYK